MRRTASGDTLTPDEFRAALSSLGWTQAHFAARVGLTPTAVNRWVRAEDPVVIPGWVTEYLGLLLELSEMHQRYIAPGVRRTD